jgi:hypothetical protein
MQVLALSKVGISSLSRLPQAGDGWQLISQYTGLQSIRIPGLYDIIHLSNSQWQALSSLRCLTSLELAAPFQSFSPLKHLIQLTSLWVILPGMCQGQHAEALTHLTRLEELSLGEDNSEDMSKLSSLADAVGAISSLHKLSLPDVPAGAWTDALARLTGLTQLNTVSLGCKHAPHPIHLPSVRVLTAHYVTARQLALITAPHLTRLEGPAWPERALGVLCEDGHSDSVRQCAAGLLRHCSRVYLADTSVLPHTSWAPAESHAALAALCQSWRPADSVMGSDLASRAWDLWICRMEFGQAEAAWYLLASHTSHCDGCKTYMGPTACSPVHVAEEKW